MRHQGTGEDSVSRHQGTNRRHHGTTRLWRPARPGPEARPPTGVTRVRNPCRVVAPIRGRRTRGDAKRIRTLLTLCARSAS